MSDENFNDLDLLRPGDPSSIPEEVWEGWRQDEYTDDWYQNGPDEEAELIANLESEPELLAEIRARIAEIDKRSSQPQVKVKYTSHLKRLILLALQTNPRMKGRDVCRWLDNEWQSDPPYGKPFIDAYEENGSERRSLDSLISQVRRSLRRRI